MDLLRRFERARARTLALTEPLSVEDQVVQPMADASPTKWHLAHTTWFFESFVLGGTPFDPSFAFLFNSYYEAIGPRVERAQRGMLTRPSLERVHAYRAHVDAAIARATVIDEARLELGLHHEEQHQELILTDLKYTLGTQPGRPAYRTRVVPSPSQPATLAWRSFAGGVAWLGAGDDGFAFDNERPRHQTLLQPFAIAERPLANAEVQAFIAEGGYRDPRWWLSEGWHAVQTQHWERPLYWEDAHHLYELAGVRPVDPAEPACHLSYFEADAIARWLGARLPTEAEWEHACSVTHEPERLHPAAHAQGDVWEWTSSSYAPYPRFRPLAGALGEYNGKFMSGQQVLRGGSCFTPRGHVRPTYRNFFPPAARWQMTGARLARDEL